MNKSSDTIGTALSRTSLASGECVQISRIDGGRKVTQRLAMLGIRPGVTICVLHGPGRRGAVLRVGGARVALGRGVADRIMVIPQPHGSILEAAAE